MIGIRDEFFIEGERMSASNFSLEWGEISLGQRALRLLRLTSLH